MINTRYLAEYIREDLKELMVMLAGPRQVGKTTLASSLVMGNTRRIFNWDNSKDRQALLSEQLPPEPGIVVLDELHKYKYWKRFLKGLFDKLKGKYQFIVTGSARLDVYRRGGDSLQGRYHHYRLHPFSYSELIGSSVQQTPMKALEFSDIPRKDITERLLNFGPFPVPCLSQNERTKRRWQKERMDRFVKEDIRDLEKVRDISLIQLLIDAVPSRVGAPISIKALSEELEVSHTAISHWLAILERLYFLFFIPPYYKKELRLLKKVPKFFLWDYSICKTKGAVFENMVASHLLKLCHYLEDVEGYRVDLTYLRDRDGREVDFLVTIDKKPWFAVEAKSGTHTPHKHLLYFKERLGIPFVYQVVGNLNKAYMEKGIHFLPIETFLSACP